MDRFSTNVGPNFDKNAAQFNDNMVLLWGQIKQLALGLTDAALPAALAFPAMAFATLKRILIH